MSTPPTFGAYVKQARQQRGDSLRGLEQRCGIHNATIKRVEDGFIAVPTPTILLGLVDALDLNLVTALKLVDSYRALYDRIMDATQKGKDR
jgi:transcriptional regulator with XRE-family HTH domain